MDLKGKVSLITGAAGGFGRVLAIEFARAHGRIVICDIKEDALLETAKSVEALGAECLPIKCDLASSAEVAAMFEKACAHFGTVQVLVNNAAIVPERPTDTVRRDKHYAYLTTPMPRQSLQFTSNMTDEEWLRMWNVNVHGVFYCTREALKRMEPRREGKIVNIASVAGLSAYSAHSPHYSATKGAVVAFTRSVAAEVAGANIYVNAIAPGGVHTPMFEEYLQKIGEEKRNQFYQLVPLGRLGTPEEYASLALYLSCDGHYLVGQIISPNGGMF